MALDLDIFIIPAYNVKNLIVADSSVYDAFQPGPPNIFDRYLTITPPGFNAVTFSIQTPARVPSIANPPIFNAESFQKYTSVELLETSTAQALPDGIYSFEYAVEYGAPGDINNLTRDCIQRSFMRVDQIQEKFDNAFMQLDMMECDRAIKEQSKAHLMSIYFFIQGSITAANNCAVIQSQKLYNQANLMLDRFLNNNCGCSGAIYR